ncbi:hypothetical protein AKJ09_03797 [Labilithrix luteola]|uniref:Uncharacterized protein n=1 Tax=Labilithrix luteola TaxID=1391654 RepID=A0A0K1PUB3_9BACT|nr:hypothetical protein [Labilithrix luteola]AKU97133.1 hypothetical protein AKJ09_03797 [Labilithrix luteola]
MTLRSRSVLLASTVALASMGVWACSENPSIDGHNVPKIGGLAPPSCEDVCNRLAQLCGYAPVDCVARCSSAEEGDDHAHRICIGQASSCREALETCGNADSGDQAGGPSGSVGSTGDAAGPDAGDDADAG